ncbi:MAG: hypothetical protein ACR2PF_06720 [Rhizobiaceae bacterium]
MAKITAEHVQKWGVWSLTMWGLLIAFVGSVVPVLGPYIGLDLSTTDVSDFDSAGRGLINALVTFFGLILAFIGRLRAKSALTLLPPKPPA